MANLYAEQKVRQIEHEWEDFRSHQYDAFTEAKVGDFVDMPYGEMAKLVRKETGVIYLDGDFTDEQRDWGEDLEDVVIYTFEEDGIYNTYVYIGEYIVWDFPNIHEYHHKSVDEIDPNDYKIGGEYTTTYEYKKGEN